MFAIIRNASHVTGTVYAGKVASRHRTAAAAVAAKNRANAACKRANGPGTWLDLTIGKIESDNRETGIARVECDTPELRRAVAM